MYPPLLSCPYRISQPESKTHNFFFSKIKPFCFALRPLLTYRSRINDNDQGTALDTTRKYLEHLREVNFVYDLGFLKDLSFLATAGKTQTNYQRYLVPSSGTVNAPRHNLLTF